MIDYLIVRGDGSLTVESALPAYPELAHAVAVFQIGGDGKTIALQTVKNRYGHNGVLLINLEQQHAEWRIG